MNFSLILNVKLNILNRKIHLELDYTRYSNEIKNKFIIYQMGFPGLFFIFLLLELILEKIETPPIKRCWHNDTLPFPPHKLKLYQGIEI